MRTSWTLKYWDLGALTRYLVHVQEGYPIHGKTHVLVNLERFFRSLNQLELVVTLRAARSLARFKEELEQASHDKMLDPEQANRLSDLMLAVEKTLRAEIEGHSVFVITPKVLDATKLMDDVPALFGPGVFNSLPEIARYDFSEAGKCIAFERPTAAAFHLLRGTESVLRDFYGRMVRRNRITNRMWGPIVADLRTKRMAASYAALYNDLDSIRVHYRNPTQHPEKTYDMSEAQDLWSLCVAVVNRMTRVLNDEGK
jgi:hypothetical protein